MIIINVTYHTKQGKREAFLSAIKAFGIDTSSKAEKGCLAYDYYYAVDDENTLFLNEIWEDEDCLKAHALTPHFAKVQELKTEFTSSVVLSKFTAEKM